MKANKELPTLEKQVRNIEALVDLPFLRDRMVVTLRYPEAKKILTKLTQNGSE